MTATDPAALRAQARALLDQADRLDTDVPRTLEELAAMAKSDPHRLEGMRQAGQLRHFLDGSYRDTDTDN